MSAEHDAAAELRNHLNMFKRAAEVLETVGDAKELGPQVANMRRELTDLKKKHADNLAAVAKRQEEIAADVVQKAKDVSDRFAKEKAQHEANLIHMTENARGQLDIMDDKLAATKTQLADLIKERDKVKADLDNLKELIASFGAKL